MQILVSGSLAIDRIMTFNGRFGDHIVPNAIEVLSLYFEDGEPVPPHGIAAVHERGVGSIPSVNSYW